MANNPRRVAALSKGDRVDTRIDSALDSRLRGNDDIRMRALSVRIRNVKCVKEVEIDLDGDIIEIRGDAGQGKTTILESLKAACSLFTHPDMVRHGESEAEVELTLSDAVIDRVIPSADSSDDDPERKRHWGSLMIKDRNGKPIERPEDFLRMVFRSSAFAPVAWVQLGAGDAKGRTERLRTQRQQLLEALPMSLTKNEVASAVKKLGEPYFDALKTVGPGELDYDQHAFVVCDGLRDRCADKRKTLNARVEDAELKLRNTPVPDRVVTTPETECRDIEARARDAFYNARAAQTGRTQMLERRAKLQEEIDTAGNLPTQEKIDKTRDHYKKLIEEQTALLETIKAEIEEYREKLSLVEQAQRDVDTQNARLEDLSKLNDALESGGNGEDLDDLKARLDDATANLEARIKQTAYDEAVYTAKACKADAEIFDALVTLFRDELPQELLGAANLPVDGLSVDGDKVMVRGVPLHQLGTSEQISVGVRVAAALNPRSPFVLVDQAESLGRADRAALARTAKELGLQLVMTFVDPDAISDASRNVVVMRGGVAV